MTALAPSATQNLVTQKTFTSTTSTALGVLTQALEHLCPPGHYKRYETPFASLFIV